MRCACSEICLTSPRGKGPTQRATSSSSAPQADDGEARPDDQVTIAFPGEREGVHPGACQRASTNRPRPKKKAKRKVKKKRTIRLDDKEASKEECQEQGQEEPDATQREEAKAGCVSNFFALCRGLPLSRDFDDPPAAPTGISLPTNLYAAFVWSPGALHLVLKSR